MGDLSSLIFCMAFPFVAFTVFMMFNFYFLSGSDKLDLIYFEDHH
jgi:hypothetical protein